MIRKVLVIILGPIVLLFVTVLALFYRNDLTRDELSEYINEESRFADLPMGASTHYRDQGNPSGPAIVLVHGGYGSLHNWEFWVPYLQRDYRIVTMDLPGHGLTGRVAGDDYTRANMVRLVHELVTELGIGSFVLGGHSMGGGVALAYALKYPEKVKSLILVGPEGIPPEGGYDIEGAFFENDADQAGDLEDKSLTLIEKLFTKFGAPWAAKAALQSIVANPDSVTPEMSRQFGRILLHEGNRRAIVLMFRQAAIAMDWQEDLIPFLHEITQPALLLFGHQDTLVPPEVGERAHRLLANSDLKLYEDVGHLIQMEVPEQSAMDVLRFLEVAAVHGHRYEETD